MSLGCLGRELQGSAQGLICNDRWGRVTHKTPDFCKGHVTFANLSVSVLPKVDWVPLGIVMGLLKKKKFHCQICVGNTGETS